MLQIHTLWLRVVWYVGISVSEEYTVSILNVKTDAARYSEPALIYQGTRRHVPEDPYLPPSEYPLAAVVNHSLKPTSL